MSMIGVDYGVLNQKGSPSWFSDIYANIPTAGYKGRMFISIDTYAFYRDTGTGWDLIGGPGTGTITGSGSSGQVSYFNGSSTLAGSNNLFWDITNSRLGIGTTTPGVSLDIHSTGTNAQFNGTGTNNAYLVFQNAGTSKWRIGNTYNAGANSFDIYNNGLANTPLSINSATNLITLSANVTTTGIQAIQNGLNLGYASGGATASYTNMSGSTTGINFALANGTGGASFIFPTAAGYSYTFPAATGTIALTSSLSSYLPLAGGTLTGQLYINPTNTGITGLDVASDTIRFRSDNLEGSKRQLEITMGSGTLVQLTAKGYGANYGTDLAFYTATTGGTNASPGIYITGTNNRVGIKNGTPSYDLDVSGTIRTTDTLYFGTSATGDIFVSPSNNNIYFEYPTSYNAIFRTQAGTEAMRLTSILGKILFGNGLTTDFSAGHLCIQCDQTTENGIAMKNTSSANNGNYMVFVNSTGGGTGSISQTGATTILFVATSDYRLKDNILPIQNAIDRVMKIKPVTYNWKNTNNEIGEGFIAHELQEIVPLAVIGVKDEMNEDGTIKSQGIDYGKLTPLLVKAIQEINEKLIRNNIN